MEPKKSVSKYLGLRIRIGALELLSTAPVRCSMTVFQF